MPFQPGQSGNPKGRAKGTKHKLSEGFLRKLHKDFRENGMAAIERVREETPGVYLKMIADLMPKEAHVTGKVKHDHTHEGVSETDAFIGGIIAAGEEAPSEESSEVRPLLPH